MLALVAFVAAFARDAYAGPESHILRIDPRASQSEGSPVLTTVIEVNQVKPANTVLGVCSALSGNAELDCVADAVEKPQALWSPIEFPDQNAFLTALVDGTDYPAKFLSKQRWGEATKEDGVGTAWLIAVDAGGQMGTRMDEAKQVATTFVNSMRPNDIANVMIFNDRSVVAASGWSKDKNKVLEPLANIPKFPVSGRTRPLGQIIQQAAIDGFKELNNVGLNIQVPMHQSMVVLSSGAAGTDATSVGPAAQLLSQYMSKGRFPEDNLGLPKMPVPIISIWFPSTQLEELFENARQFMEKLPNTDIGGAFFIVRDGQASRATNIVAAVRARFDKMWIVKWQVSCVEPTITQTFHLSFRNTDPLIAPDFTFQNVPVGIDPQAWPLDVDMEATVAEAEKNPVYPGGKLKVYGNFCWGGKKERAELYMVPKNQEVPATLANGTIEDAKNAQRTLIEAGMRGQAIATTDTYVEFEVPDKTKFLAGKKDAWTARLVVFDNVSKRTSAITQNKIVTLKAEEAPLPILMIGGIAFGGVVLLLLVVTAIRGGGGKRRSGNAPPPPRPVVGAPAPAPMQPMMAAPPGPAFVSRATLSGNAGIYTVLPGMEMKAGRDGALCQILLNEPRVSGTHATMKIEGGQLFARDDNSNNGTTLNGQRLAPGVFSPVPNGASLKFGPIEFTVSLE